MRVLLGSGGFRTMENGTAIDFVLSREQVAALPQ